MQIILQPGMLILYWIDRRAVSSFFAGQVDAFFPKLQGLVQPLPRIILLSGVSYSFSYAAQGDGSDPQERCNDVLGDTLHEIRMVFLKIPVS